MKILLKNTLTKFRTNYIILTNMAETNDHMLNAAIPLEMKNTGIY